MIYATNTDLVRSGIKLPNRNILIFVVSKFRLLLFKVLSTKEYISPLITTTPTLELEISPNGAQRDQDFLDVEDDLPALCF